MDAARGCKGVIAVLTHEELCMLLECVAVAQESDKRIVTTLDDLDALNVKLLSMIKALTQQQQQPGLDTFSVEHGALREAPVWETHKRGKNWWAKISINPKAPGGLDRVFAETAKGDFLYIIPEWCTPGCPVEFGADYISARGKKTYCRWYGVIRHVTEHSISIQPCKTAKEAADAHKHT